MREANRSVESASASESAKLDQFASRPTKTNCTTPESRSLPAGESSWEGYWWKQKNALVDQFVEEYPNRAARPISVRGGELLREECTLSRPEGEGPVSKSWSSVMNEYLKWYNGYRDSHLVFRDPDGNRVRTQMENAHMPEYGDKYYAKLKALERQIASEYDDLHIAMLTFTGSTKNGNGGWRAVSDHLRDVIDSWRPDRGRGVYHALRDSLECQEWEYALVVEKHQSGYGHVHCAVFVDGEVDESDFHPAIDAHLRTCNIAHRDAHNYFAEDETTRPISVSSVDTDLDPNRGDVDKITNVGTYIGEYIGSYGEPLFDRSIEELAFRAAVWATGTQLVRFSTGANELIREELDREQTELKVPELVQKPEFDPEAEDPGETVEGSPFDVVNKGWSLEGVGRVDSEGETIYDVQNSGVQFVEIADSSHLDPINSQPPDRPQPRAKVRDLESF
ncbi:MAG: hypothetical protein U5K70_03365 [Halodesulfurarchaeum sp.]|nr:hypothetical protein [Halodesulfurarchaeum sp.]